MVVVSRTSMPRVGAWPVPSSWAAAGRRSMRPARRHPPPRPWRRAIGSDPPPSHRARVPRNSRSIASPATRDQIQLDDPGFARMPMPLASSRAPKARSTGRWLPRSGSPTRRAWRRSPRARRAQADAEPAKTAGERAGRFRVRRSRWSHRVLVDGKERSSGNPCRPCNHTRLAYARICAGAPGSHRDLNHRVARRDGLA